MKAFGYTTTTPVTLDIAEGQTLTRDFDSPPSPASASTAPSKTGQDTAGRSTHDSP